MYCVNVSVETVGLRGQMHDVGGFFLYDVFQSRYMMVTSVRHVAHGYIYNMIILCYYYNIMLLCYYYNIMLLL